jgi:hypothetical protein
MEHDLASALAKIAISSHIVNSPIRDSRARIAIAVALLDEHADVVREAVKVVAAGMWSSRCLS